MYNLFPEWKKNAECEPWALCLLRQFQDFGFDLGMTVSVCVTSKTYDRKSNQGYTYEWVFRMWVFWGI